MDRINKKLESLDNTDRSAIYTKEEKKNDSFLDLYEKLKVLNSPLKNEREFEPHHRHSFPTRLFRSYNDNSSTNNLSILTGDKINRQTNKHNDSFLDKINKKLE